MSDTAASETIGARLRRLREERGLSQRALASPGIGYAYISRVERGDRRPSLKALRQLASRLGVTVEYLETGTDVAPAEVRELKLGEAELALRLDGDVAAAERALEEVVADALAHGDLRDATRARIGLGLAAAHRGEHARAIELLGDAAGEAWVTPVTHANVFATLGHSYICTGEGVRAAKLLRGALERVLETSAVERATIVRYATYLSYALADGGDLAGARAALDQALGHARAIDDPYTRVRIFWSNARLASLDGDPDMARLSINRAIGLLETTEDTVYLGRAHLLAAEIALTEDDLTAAREHLEDAAVLVDGASELIDRAWLRVQQALVEARDGDPSIAIDHATEAIELLEGHDDRTLRGCGHWALGEALAAAGADGAARKAFREASELIDPADKYAQRFVEAWQRQFPADVATRP